jgi:hypothetical protein
MDSFFFHVKGGQEFNWRHVDQKKSTEMFAGQTLDDCGPQQVWVACSRQLHAQDYKVFAHRIPT